MSTHFITAGGGGFSMSPTGAPTALDRYVVEVSGKQRPQVCFAPTASADSATYVNRFLNAYGSMGVRTQVLSLWEDAARSVDRLAEADVLLVGGGSTVNLMALWQAHGVDRAIKNLVSSGNDVVFAGLSAGAACWYQACITDSFGGLRPWRGGLGLLKGSFCPHLDGEEARGPAFTEAVAAGIIPGGWAADDGAALHWTDDKLTAVVAERAGARAFEVMPSSEPTASGVLGAQLDVQVL